MGFFLIVLILIGSLFFLIFSRKKGITSQKNISKNDEDLGLGNPRKSKKDLLEEEVNNLISLNNGNSQGSILIPVDGLSPTIHGHDFTCIDFETANRKRISAISLGIAVFKGNKLVEAKRFIFRNADGGKFEFTHINNFVESDLRGMRQFKDHWDEIKPYIENQLIVGHNISFDLGVLEALISHFELDRVDFRFNCTLELSRMRLDNSERPHNLKLETLCEHFSVPYWSHEAALDAVSCGCVYLHLLKYSEKNRKLKFDLYGNIFSYSDISQNPARVIQTSNIKKLPSENELLNRSVVVTGGFPTLGRDSVEKYVEQLGAKRTTSISKKTFMVVVGIDPGQVKLEKVNEINHLKEQIGEDLIKIIDEKDFISLLEINNIKIQ